MHAPSEDTKNFPVGATAAFIIVLMASILPWGTIKHHYTWQFMANLEHPGLCNRVLTDDDLSTLKMGSDVNYTGSAWKSGFDLFDLFYPHWILTVAALFLFLFSVLNVSFQFSINPTIPLVLSFYGMIHVVASAMGFFSQGSIEWGLILTGLGYLVFVISALRWK